MAVAKLYPDGQPRGRGGKGIEKIPIDAAKQTVSHARTVLRWAPELAALVLADAALAWHQ